VVDRLYDGVIIFTEGEPGQIGGSLTVDQHWLTVLESSAARVALAGSSLWLDQLSWEGTALVWQRRWRGNSRFWRPSGIMVDTLAQIAAIWQADQP